MFDSDMFLIPCPFARSRPSGITVYIRLCSKPKYYTHMASAFDVKELELQKLKSCNAQKTQPNDYLNPDIFITLFPRSPFISKDNVSLLHAKKYTASDFWLLTQPLPHAKPYWFWKALPQVGKIITGSLQARKSTAIMSTLCQPCEILSVPSIRSCRNCSPLRQGSDQCLSNKPEVTQLLKICCSSRIFSVVLVAFSFLTVAEWPFSSFFISVLVCFVQYMPTSDNLPWFLTAQTAH